MWKGRVWTERSALRLLRRRAAKFRSFYAYPQRLAQVVVPGRRCMGVKHGGVLGPLPWIFRKSKVEGRGPHLQGGGCFNVTLIRDFWSCDVWAGRLSGWIDVPVPVLYSLLPAREGQHTRQSLRGVRRCYRSASRSRHVTTFNLSSAHTSKPLTRAPCCRAPAHRRRHRERSPRRTC